MTDQQRDGSVSLSEVTGTLSTRGYNLIRKLGEGTYAKVYMASFVPPNDPKKKMLLACKVVDTAKAPRGFVKRFLPRELDILKRLNHPHIVHVHSIFQRRNKYFIFMRLAEKGDLLDWVLRHGAVTEAQSRVWLRQLALALQYLQALEVAHRDLKCENVLITANYNVKLADFGFARYCVDAKGRRVLSGTNCGSLSYAAPEILRGEHYDPRISDVWSLGVVLYIMLNKAMPFDDTNINRLHDEQIHRRWRFCAGVVDTLSDQVKNLIYNMLEPDTRRRFVVDQILASDWIAMDARLASTTTAERAALVAAKEDRERRMLRDAADPAGAVLTLPPPTTQSDMGGVFDEVESLRYQEDSAGNPEGDGTDKALPRTPEEMDVTAQRSPVIINPHAQPSHGAISIMDSEPLPDKHPPEFLPPDLTEKLTSKAPSHAVSERLPNKVPSHTVSEKLPSKSPSHIVLEKIIGTPSGIDVLESSVGKPPSQENLEKPLCDAPRQEILENLLGDAHRQEILENPLCDAPRQEVLEKPLCEASRQEILEKPLCQALSQDVSGKLISKSPSHIVLEKAISKTSYQDISEQSAEKIPSYDEQEKSTSQAPSEEVSERAISKAPSQISQENSSETRSKDGSQDQIHEGVVEPGTETTLMLHQTPEEFEA